MLHKPPTKHPLHPAHITDNPLKRTSDFSSTVFNTNWTHSPSQTWSDNPHFCHPTYLTGSRTGGCTLTLNMVINQLHHFLNINLNVILSSPVWSSMKFQTRIQITCSSLYAIRSAHHNLIALWNNTCWILGQNIFLWYISSELLLSMSLSSTTPCLGSLWDKTQTWELQNIKYL
jgi:hypothetical protein